MTTSPAKAVILVLSFENSIASPILLKKYTINANHATTSRIYPGNIV
jgi:hypothetical protein